MVTGHLFNLPAVAIVLALTWLCYIGIRESSTLNALMVLVKVGLIVIVVIAGYRYVNPENWHPFIPEPQGDGKYGWSGIMRGAAMVFFAYIGFEATSTAAQECKTPQRDLPFGILVSLVICTVLYLAMAAVLTGLVPYTMLDTAEPVVTAVAAHPKEPGLAAADRGDRRHDRPVVGDPGDDHRAATHLIEDHGARRHAAEGVRQGASRATARRTSTR
ncbi:Putrescine transporter PotE [Rhodanobacter lindaniclasticus]